MSVDSFYHGVEIVEKDDGIRPIKTVRSSVIGVVGTAPNSAPEVKSTLALGGLVYTSALYGKLGNEISVHHIGPRKPDQALAVTVTDRAIAVSLATDAAGIITSTDDEVAAAIATNTDAAALVTVAAAGTGATAPIYRAAYLSGGADEPFPLNKPVLVAGKQREAAKLGKGGTLPDAMTGIFRQTGAVVIVVRVAEGTDEGDTLQNVAGGVDAVTGDYLGAHAFLGSETATGFCPRILIAPGWTHQIPIPAAKNPVAAEFEGLTQRLRAVAIVDGPNTNDAEAIDQRKNYGTKRIYFHEVFYTIMKDGAPVNVPASAYIAGLGARIDNEKGFWHSWSNQEVFGIIGTARPIDYTPGDKTSRANLLNEAEVATTIRMEGFRLWGNRTTAFDQRWAFLSRVRTYDMINEAILQSHQWAVDRNITRTYFEDVADSVNAFLDRMQSNEAIAGGRCWADKEFNTPANIESGNAVFSVDYSDYLPAERVTFRTGIVNDFLEDIL